MRLLTKKFIVSILCLSLVLNGYPIQSSAEDLSKLNLEDEATFAEVAEKHFQNMEELFEGPNAPAELVEVNGELVARPKKNLSTVDAVNGTEDSKESADTLARIDSALTMHAVIAPKIAEIEKANKEASVKNKECNSGNCGAGGAADDEDSKIPPGGLCSKKDKEQISFDRENKPECSFGCEATTFLSTFPPAAPIAIPLAMTTGKACKITSEKIKNNNVLSCAWDVLKTFVSSIGSMATAVYDGIVGGAKAATNWVKGLFSSHEDVEKSAADRSMDDAGKSDEDIKKGQENPELAKKTFLQKIFRGLELFGEYVIGLDVPVYKEQWLCAKCGERISALCKMVGVLGKDAVKNFIMIYLGGKVIQAAGKVIIKTAAGAKNTAFKVASKSTIGQKTISWGAGKYVKTTSKVLEGWSTFTTKTKTGAFLLKYGTKVVVLGDKAGSWGYNLIKNKVVGANSFPGKITIAAGTAVGNKINAIKNRVGVFKKAPKGALPEEATESGLAKLDDLGNTDTPLEIGVPGRSTPQISEAKAFVNKDVASKKLDLDGIEDAAVVRHDPVNEGSVKFLHEGKEVYVSVPYSSEVKRILPFNKTKAFVEDSFGNVHIAHLEGTQGKIVHTFTKDKAKNVNALLGKEDFNANVAAVKEVRENLEASGIKTTEQVASNKADDIKIKKGAQDGKTCPPKDLDIGPAGGAAQ